MEEVGQGYLKELISRCMVQLVDKDEFATVTAVVVHDRLHAFAQEEAQEACFVESHDSTDVLAPATVRRLAVQNTTDRHVHLGNALPKLRTIVCDFASGGAAKPSVCIHSTDLGFLHASKFLRVIDIHGLELKKLPDELGSMIHIRYLGLQCGQLERLPSTISKLGERLEFGDGAFRSLQKLRLGLPDLEEWAVSAGSMAALARLTLLRCAKMEMLPEALGGMKELEEVVLYSMPKMVGRIKEDGGQDHHKIKHVPVIQTIW
ncbi:unnamed protein product [Triticum turgidum subsp. durum]|uniref:Disease resistance protein winged helix domain-containing protein n=1 Tax=Triticum turgidum subsp. durum TaxID=4567 RepID=A0A9R0RWD9_TRITD|nr:unnamed protein product [Triticum turgidum subsp. durum]